MNSHNNPAPNGPRATRPLTLQRFTDAMRWPDAVDSAEPSPKSGFAGKVHREKCHAMRMYNITNWVINGLLITQAAVSAVLISLGSTGNMYRVQIAVLGGVNGVTTGALSIIKGQGLPNRYWQYASGLTSVGLKIDELERKFRAGIVVTEEDLEQLWKMYEDVYHQFAINNPDLWKNITALLQSSRSTADPRPTRPAGDAGGTSEADPRPTNTAGDAGAGRTLEV